MTTRMTNLQSDIVSEAYKDLERWIHKTVHDFAKTTRMANYDDLFDEAQDAFLRATRSYNPSRGSITNHVRRVIWFHLLTWRRKQQMLLQREEPMEVLPERGTDPKFQLEQFNEFLSNDAKTVVRLVLDSHLQLDQVIQTKNKRYAFSSLKAYLKSVEWSDDRVENTIAEIWRALRVKGRFYA